MKTGPAQYRTYLDAGVNVIAAARYESVQVALAIGAPNSRARQEITLTLSEADVKKFADALVSAAEALRSEAR